jgi:hypothetical protein
MLLIISQIRDNIGVTFGETKKRSGGRALDFYASQVVWLAEIGKIKRTVSGVERVVGAHVKARCKKNKVGMAYREVELTVIFSYGVDDELSMIDWLAKNKGLSLLAGAPSDKELKRSLGDARSRRDVGGVAELREYLRAGVYEHWLGIETALEPPLSKY